MILICYLICDSSPDVILLSETWLTNSCFNLPSYNSFHFVRQKERSGGVTICISDTETFTELQGNLRSTTFEFVGRIIQTECPIICLCMYRPPSSAIDVFLEELDQLLDNLY